MTENNKAVRIQKFLSQQGICSRREAEILIRQGKIILNGTKATLGDRVGTHDDIQVEGRTIAHARPDTKLLLFFKPEGVECTLRPFHNHKTLANFNFSDKHLFPVGRLDKNSEGLLVLTNDGDLANKLMHPRYEHEKEYEVSVNKPLKKEALQKMEQGGIPLEERQRTYPCKIQQEGVKSFRIILTEGRKRQIRRMCRYLGYEVLHLRRVRIETLTLEGLKPGEWRPASEKEEKELRSRIENTA